MPMGNSEKSADINPFILGEGESRVNELREVVVQGGSPAESVYGEAEKIRKRIAFYHRGDLGGSIQGGSPVESFYGEAEKQQRRIAFYHREKQNDLAMQNSSPYALPKMPTLQSTGLVDMMSTFKRRIFVSQKERAAEPTLDAELPDADTLMSPKKLDGLRVHSTSRFLGGGSSHRVELKLIQDALSFTKDSMGGEGVHYVEASKKAGSGYWMASILAIRGRPVGFIPMTVYSCYTVLVVCLLQWNIKMYPIEPSTPSSNAISNGGSINGTQSTTQIIQGLQSAVLLISTALFFLQTFRTNHAYNRWWEGRCLWATVTAHILTISRTIAGRHIKSQQLGRRMLRWSAAFMVSLKASLRGEDDLDELDGLLNATEVNLLELKPIDFRPLFCLQNIQEAWGMSQDDKIIRECASKELEKVMPELSTGMMGLKRISNTSLPFGYVSHLRSFLVIWLCLLPFIYTYQMGYYAIGISIIIAYSLLGMEQLSLEMEFPFGREFNHLPMDSMTKQTLSELCDSYSTTVKLPRFEGSAVDLEEEEPELYSSKRTVYSSKRTTMAAEKTLTKMDSPGLHTVPENPTTAINAEDYPDRGHKNPMFAKMSDGSYHSIKAEKSLSSRSQTASSYAPPPRPLPLHEAAPMLNYKTYKA